MGPANISSSDRFFVSDRFLKLFFLADKKYHLDCRDFKRLNYKKSHYYTLTPLGTMAKLHIHIPGQLVR